MVDGVLDLLDSETESVEPQAGDVTGEDCGLCDFPLVIHSPHRLHGDITVLIDKKKHLEKNIRPRWVYWVKCIGCGAVG